MTRDAIPESLLSQLSEFVAETMGLHFPPERWADLQRGLAGAAEELGFAEANACIDWLLSSRSAGMAKTQLHVLASHLTVGETYFFREKKTFDALAESVIPELIRSRRNAGRRLRFWSAACCTGEEPYSLAILLHWLIPDLADWNVTVLATDINNRFLGKAASGVYGEWSFRETPAWIKDRYFHRAVDGRYEILPEVKKLVSFAHLNLVEDVYPSLEAGANAMEVIFCRNVLMYFTLPQTRKVVRSLRNVLVDGGWLVVSPSEGSQALFSSFVPVSFPGAILYQKSEAKLRTEHQIARADDGESGRLGDGQAPTFLLSHSPTQPYAPALETSLSWTPHTPEILPAESSPAAVADTPTEAVTSFAAAESLYQQGRYGEAVEVLLTSLGDSFVSAEPVRQAHGKPQAFSLLARALANQGNLTEALAWSERWITSDKLDSSGHYVRALILQELGDIEPARRSLQRAIYLQPDFVMAHFALANLARAYGKSNEANKHFTNALHLLHGHQHENFLPEAGGLTAGRLSEIIASITAKEATP